MIIIAENTAIITGISKSATELEKHCSTEKKILDYGAGKLRNSRYLKSKGYKVSILDTDFQIKKVKEEANLTEYENVYTLETYQPQLNYDSVLCSFVLNVIPEPIERTKAIKNIHQSLKEDGMLFLEVRKKHGIMKNKYKEPYNDGFVVGKHKIKTFQKPFEAEEIINLLNKNQFKVETLQSLSDSVLAIAKKLK